MNDYISRQAAIEAVNRLSLGVTDAVRLSMKISDYLNRLSSAQPEQRWIPCSERLPEIGEKVLITKRKTDEMTEVCTARYNVTRWCATGIISNSNVIAWMPLPEPYKGEEE